VVVRPLPEGPALEHRTSRTGRWLRARRVRFALWIAVAEGILIVVHAIPKLTAIVVAAAIVAVYLWAGRRLRSDAGRQFGWIVAGSQALVMLVPVFLIFFWTLALIAVAILGVVALIALFSQRT
jgi:hypothetical protein